MSVEGQLLGRPLEDDPAILRRRIAELERLFALQEEMALQHFELLEKARQEALAAVQAKHEALDVARSKSDFLANMSHEIRTPLNAVIGMAQLLVGTPLDAEQTEYVTTIHSSGEHLLALLNDILDFSKMEAGEFQLEQAPFDARQTVEEAVVVASAIIGTRPVDLAYEVSPEVPARIVGDSGRLRQLLLNLIGNAVKFTQEGEIVVDVGAVALAGGTHELRFSVRDTGAGISVEDMGRLFKAFSQIDSSMTRARGGTGLGLAISRRLAAAMGGRIWADSEGHGKGSTFTFTIHAAGAVAPKAVEHAPPSVELVGLRVLLVDDLATNRRILRQHARRLGMVPTEACDGAAALSRLEAGEDCDLAILDLHMPGMDGVELARNIRALRPTLPMLLTTHAAVRPSAATLNAAGIQACLAKPLRQSELQEVFLAALSRAPHARTSADLPPSLERLRVLVVEDNVFNQRVVTRMLERLGHDVVVARDGREALECVAASTGAAEFEVILMDVQMEGMDGYEATRRIRARWPGRHRIVGLTANALAGDREACIVAGMDDYLAKPVRFERVRQLLDDFVRGRAGEV